MPIGLRVPRRVELRDEDVLGDEPPRDGRDALGGAQQKPRRDYQDRGHPDLRGDQGPLASAAARRPEARCPRKGRRPERRHQQQPEADGGPRRHGDGQRPQRGAGVRGRRLAEWRELRQRRQDGTHPPQGRERGQPAGAHQHQQLGREGADDVPARRPQRAPHRLLVRLLGAAGQQQQDQVAAGGQEEDARDHGQDAQEPCVDHCPKRVRRLPRDRARTTTRVVAALDDRKRIARRRRSERTGGRRPDASGGSLDKLYAATY